MSKKSDDTPKSSPRKCSDGTVAFFKPNEIAKLKPAESEIDLLQDNLIQSDFEQSDSDSDKSSFENTTPFRRFRSSIHLSNNSHSQSTEKEDNLSKPIINIESYETSDQNTFDAKPRLRRFRSSFHLNCKASEGSRRFSHVPSTQNLNRENDKKDKEKETKGSLKVKKPLKRHKSSFNLSCKSIAAENVMKRASRRSESNLSQYGGSNLNLTGFSKVDRDNLKEKRPLRRFRSSILLSYKPPEAQKVEEKFRKKSDSDLTNIDNFKRASFESLSKLQQSNLKVRRPLKRYKSSILLSYKPPAAQKLADEKEKNEMLQNKKENLQVKHPLRRFRSSFHLECRPTSMQNRNAEKKKQTAEIKQKARFKLKRYSSTTSLTKPVLDPDNLKCKPTPKSNMNSEDSLLKVKHPLRRFRSSIHLTSRSNKPYMISPFQFSDPVRIPLEKTKKLRRIGSSVLLTCSPKPYIVHERLQKLTKAGFKLKQSCHTKYTSSSHLPPSKPLETRKIKSPLESSLEILRRPITQTGSPNIIPTTLQPSAIFTFTATVAATSYGSILPLCMPETPELEPPRKPVKTKKKKIDEVAVKSTIASKIRHKRKSLWTAQNESTVLSSHSHQTHHIVEPKAATSYNTGSHHYKTHTASHQSTSHLSASHKSTSSCHSTSHQSSSSHHPMAHQSSSSHHPTAHYQDPGHSTPRHPQPHISEPHDIVQKKHHSSRHHSENPDSLRPSKKPRVFSFSASPQPSVRISRSARRRSAIQNSMRRHNSMRRPVVDKNKPRDGSVSPHPTLKRSNTHHVSENRQMNENRHSGRSLSPHPSFRASTRRSRTQQNLKVEEPNEDEASCQSENIHLSVISQSNYNCDASCSTSSQPECKELNL